MSNRNSSSLHAQTKTQSDKDTLSREKLPRHLQNLVDDESVLDQIYDGTANQSTDSNVRYAAYASRVRTILLSAHRYVAYTSDIGESFRPVAHPWLIKSAYGISWAYLIGDVGNEGYKAYLRNRQLGHFGAPGVASQGSSDAGERVAAVDGEPERRHVPAIEDYRAVMAQRAVFQSIASMGLPAFTIHSIVKYSGRAVKDAKNTRIRVYGPIGLGLAAVPFLPYMFDKSVEEATEWTFYKAFRMFGGPEAVGETLGRGRARELLDEGKKRAGKDKEL
ncbi:MAG: hypothetical protein Q9163_001768 [Psora crenata]